MKTVISPDKQTLGREAAQAGAEKLRAALEARGAAAIIVATGASQFEMLQHLVAVSDIHWPRVTVFHLDEYVGMDTDHPASFVRYLQERFLAALPQAPAAFHAVNGLADGRRLVPHSGGRAHPRHLHVHPPDPEVPQHHLQRAGPAQGGGG
jgi:glucosamine-6-phosphate deaminase